jgi:hypothetical protein
MTVSRAAKPISVKQYVLRRLDEGERDLNVLARQARIQFPSVRVTFSYLRAIRNEWQKLQPTPAIAALPEFTR